MAACLLALVAVTPLFISLATCRSTGGHFPLEDCSGDMDLVSMMEDMPDQLYSQSVLFKNSASKMFALSPRSNRSNLLIAEVLDHFSSHNVSTGVGDWSFETFPSEKGPYYNWSLANLQIQNSKVSTILEQKIQFVERLFNETRGVRMMSIHVGVIFLNGTGLKQEEIINVSTMLQQRHSSDVKIFVVVIGDTLVHLTDTLVLNQQELETYGHILMMAICKQCSKGEILFEHTVGAQWLSCYRFENGQKRSWREAYSQCNRDSARLAAIETTDEMTFLRNYTHGFLKNNSNLWNYDSHNAKVFIGLKRDTMNYAKLFKWFLRYMYFYPMIINHWSPGKPSGGYSYKECGMWKFSHVSENRTIQTVSSDKDDFVEGWEAINCGTPTAHLSLCEYTLPRKVEPISIKRASTKRFDSALRKGDFVTFKGNIVSVSENVENNNFYRFVTNNSKKLPLFDCGQDAGKQRYIPYSFVCDSIYQCRNKRDESICLARNGDCKSGQKLLHKAMWCDNVKDCKDGSDEMENCCSHLPCDSVRCRDGSCTRRQWIKYGEFGECSICSEDSSFRNYEEFLEIIYSKNGTNCALLCNRDRCIDTSQLDDGNKDCLGPEGPLDETIGKLKPANTCKNIMGHTIWAPKCVYVVDRYGGIIGCRDVSHLRDCKSFQCREGYVKCQGSYCIPQHYLLDGKADCPTGEDEQPFYVGPCTGNFACWGNKVCLHPDLVCDGHADCPHKDDELSCHLCPEGFRCTGGTVTVSGYNAPNPLTIPYFEFGIRTTYIDFSGINFPLLEELLLEYTKYFVRLKFLILSKCNITEFRLDIYLKFTTELPSYMITYLDLSYNMIGEIFGNDYRTYTLKYIKYLNVSFNAQLTSVKNLQFIYLKILDLSHTGLSHLNDSVFASLPMLQHLNLSHTLISDFSRKYFSDSFALKSLDLRGMPIANFHSFSFHDLTVRQNLYADHVEICCPQIRGHKTPSHACHAPVDAISSCFHLVKLPIQRVLLWVVAVLAVLGNMAVIVYRVIWDRSVLKTGYGLFVTNLSVSDFIMGVYLFIIAGADYFFRDVYVLHDKLWKQSVLCKLAGFLATLSSEASTLFVFLITLDRFLVIKFPFGQKQLATIPKVISVVLSWLVSFSVSLVPIVFKLDIYSRNPVCLGLPLTNLPVIGWEYSVAVFVIFNFLMFILIACGQYAILRAISDNRISKRAGSISRSRRAEDITVAKQLSLIVLSNFLCWFPVGLMGLMSLGGHNVSDEVYAWTTVLLLPINSAVNPVLYTIPALLARWENFKYGDPWSVSASV